MISWFSRFFASSATSLVARVNDLEPSVQRASDAELAARTTHFRQRLEKGEPLESLLPEAFATAREAARRALGMRHFDVQVQGGVELARGHIVEMKTGEGKTLVATLPAYLHALQGKGVHIVTVNDYLARRDAEWMGRVYRFLGLTVGCIQEQMGNGHREETRLRKEAYAADITYGTNSEIVFDFLRDNLAHDPGDIVQRGQHAAIVDEVDLLLIDEAQTPLIISGQGAEDTGVFVRVDAIVRKLRPGEDFQAERRTKSATLTEVGLVKVETSLGVGSLADPANLSYMHAVHQSLQAHGIFTRDVDYIVTDGGEVHIVDEHTGRVSPDKRFSNGLHQALEAKERVRVKTEDVTLAKTSYQHFFRGYTALSGMTGTAHSEKEEFRKIYQKKIVRLPTHKPMIRKDWERIIFLRMNDKHAAVADEIREMREEGRPVLVGTVSVLESEQLSRLLTRQGIPHNVLNAKQHDREAEVIAQAGREGAVTISTNMAGRGTDILLGGNPERLAADKHEPGTAEYAAALREYEALCAAEKARVVKAGGLHVIGTGEHESVRIDNQLRGRAGRQGDPGSSIFVVSLEDPVYRMFGEKQLLAELLERLAAHPPAEPVEDEDVSRALTALRKKVEVENEAIRLDVFKYDLVIHDNRQQVWAWRRKLLQTEEASQWRQSAEDLVGDLVETLCVEIEKALGKEREETTPPTEAERWRALAGRIFEWEQRELPTDTPFEISGIVSWLMERYDSRFGRETDELVRRWERYVLLMTIDRQWPQFLTDVERLEEGIFLRGYSQLDPLVEFRREVGMMFGMFLTDVRLTALRAWLNVNLHVLPDPDQMEEPSEPARAMRPRGGARPAARNRAVDRLPPLRRGAGRRKRKG